MRTRLVSGFVVVCALIAAALVFWQSPGLVRGRIAHELAAMGLEQARFTVTSLGWSRLTLADVELAADLSVRDIEIDYRDPLSLLAGDLDVVTIRGADWTTSLDRLEASTPVRLLGRAGAGTPPGRIQIVDARVSLPEVTLLADAEITPASAGFTFTARTLDGRSTLELSGDPRAMAWRFGGSVPEALAAHLASSTPLEGEVRATGHGSAQHQGRWLVDGELELAVDGMRVPSIDARLRGVRATLDGEAIFDEHLALRIDAHCIIALDRASISGARIEGAEVAGMVRVERADTSWRAFADAGLDLRARLLAVGRTRATELRFTHGVLAGSTRPEQPFLEIDERSAHLALGMVGRAAVGGVLHASSVRLRGDVDVTSGAEGARASLPLALESPSIHVRDAETTIADARIELPLSWDERGRFSAAGAVHAGALSWRDVELGAIDGSLDLSDDRITIDWEGAATETARFRLRGLVARSTTIDVEVPMSEVSPSDAFHRALVATVGIDVRGRAGGELHVEPGSIGMGTARLTVDGASVDDVAGRGGARGARGTVVLASLDPVASASADRLAFTELRLGQLLDTRDGSARVRFEPSGDVTIEDAQASLAGGHFYASTFRFAPMDPDLSLTLRFDGIQMDRIAALLTHDGVHVSGVLDGHLAMRVHLGDAPAMVLGEGVLVARGPGRLQVTALPSTPSTLIDVTSLASGSWIEDRVLRALADFEYSDMTFDIDRVGGEPCLHASVSGHGARTPQEIDLNVAVEDVQLLVDQSIRFWTASEIAHVHTGEPS